MPGFTLYKRIFAQFLLLCVCIGAANSCPKRKLIAVEQLIAVTQRADIPAVEAGYLKCSAGISPEVFHEVAKTGGKLPPPAGAIFVSLNLLLNTPGSTFYLPPAPPGPLKSDTFPIFLKNRVLLV